MVKSGSGAPDEVTDEDRREVSARLRAYAKQFETPTWNGLCNAVFGDDKPAYSLRRLHLVDRLADLIDHEGASDAE